METVIWRVDLLYGVPDLGNMSAHQLRASTREVEVLCFRDRLLVVLTMDGALLRVLAK